MPYDLNFEVAEGLEERVDAASLAGMIAQVLTDDDIEDNAALSIVVADDVLLHDLNRRHRNVDAPTDVLSFPAAEGEEFPAVDGEPVYLGDIVISLERVERQAAEVGLAADAELAHVVLHGVLHLLGYDHVEPEDEAEMTAREEAVLGPEIHAGRAAHDD